MTADLSRVNQWIYSILSADPVITAGVGTRIFADEAPQGSIDPMVIFAFLGGAERLRPLGSQRFSTALYLVRAVAKGSSYDPIEAVADRIDALLTLVGQTVTVRDVRISMCEREQAHQRKDATHGVPYVYLGGFYRLYFQPASQ